jgi:hypothetical protein
MPLQRADVTKTERFEDAGAWLELRTRLTKRDNDIISDLNSHYRLPAGLFGIKSGEDSDPSVEVRGNLTQTNRTLFDLLAIGWSITDEKPTAADYDTLDPDSGNWVDECITKALKAGRARAEGKATSTASAKDSPGSSRSAGRSRSKTSPTKSDD